MNTQQLNLARKWRSKQFDQIIGQELSVRMLKNSLYLNQFFPVYLFSGQRGCGKTTTARVFAAALNCQQLAAFQKNPKATVIPCLTCDSCQAMANANHPDFIEIDAASHTGVDNVRTIIEAASFLPVLGKKKIYLIDEAHMLSKAAFNAFLKILEEPPAAVIFMLATTDPQKILETVRSRCFQLLFPAIAPQALVAHVRQVCVQEGIKADDQALYTIVKETEGSARDALNLLEQVRFAVGTITQEAVFKTLGHLPENQLLTLFEKIAANDGQGVMEFLQSIQFESYHAVNVWNKVVELVRAALFAKYGVRNAHHIADVHRFEKLVNSFSVSQLSGFLQMLYEHELLLAKTTVQHGMLELLFLTMCGQQAAAVVDQPVLRSSQSVVETVQRIIMEPVAQKSSIQQPAVPVVPQQNSGEHSELWQHFLTNIEGLSDPLLASIFKQAQFQSFDPQTGQLVVICINDGTFFTDWLKETELIWMGLLRQVFGATVQYSPVFQERVREVSSSEKLGEKSTQTAQSSHAAGTIAEKRSARASGPQVGSQEKVINITDKETWKTANQLVEAFGGTVVEAQSDENIE